MNSLLVLLPVSGLLLLGAVWVFAWAVRSGQFEDVASASLDVLVDDEAPRDAG